MIMVQTNIMVQTDIMPPKMGRDFEQSECKKGNLILAVFFYTGIMILETVRKKMIIDYLLLREQYLHNCNNMNAGHLF